MVKIFIHTQALIICSFLISCQQNSKNAISKKLLNETENTQAFFEYYSNNDNESRFVKFYEDSLAWGTNDTIFVGYYSEDREMDALTPWSRSSGYNVRFSENFTAITILEQDFSRRNNLFNHGESLMFLSLKTGYRYPYGQVLSVDYANEYILLHSYQVNGMIDTEYPLCVVKFPQKNKRREFQNLKVRINDEKPKSIVGIFWGDQKLKIKYINELSIENEADIGIEL